MKAKSMIEIQCNEPEYIQQLLIEIICEKLHIQPNKDDAA